MERCIGFALVGTMTMTIEPPVEEPKEDDLKPAGDPILARISAGDESAVELCLERYGALVWSLARKMCRAEAEDATQEIFIEIWQKASAYDSTRSSEASFITMIARRRLIDRIRRSGGQISPETMLAEVADVASAQAVDPLEVSDEVAKASQCLEKLSQTQQKVLALSIHHGASHSSISKRLAIPLGTVKSFSRRALIQLRDCMQRPNTSLQGLQS